MAGMSATVVQSCVPGLGADLGKPREPWHGRSGFGAGSVWLTAAPLLCGLSQRLLQG